MTSPGVPPQAITAAWERFVLTMEADHPGWTSAIPPREEWLRLALSAALEAAAPHLAAAEREQCAQLAEDRAATCIQRDENGDMVGVMSFADLLRQEGGGT